MAKIERLKLKLWQELLYLVFVMIIPTVITAIEIFHSHNSVFEITFSSLGCILLTVILIRKFVFESKIEKLQNKCILAEHDYEIDVGNKDKIRHGWAVRNMIILGYHVIVTVLSLLLVWLFISALADQIIKFKGAATIILASCLVGITVKFLFYALMLRTSEVNDESKQV